MAKTIKVTIDPGHDKYSNVSPVNPKYIEGVQMWKLGTYLKKALEAYGIEVVLTRPKVSDTIKEVTERGKLAADNGSDLMISLHSNAPASNADGTYNTSITGTVVYYSLTDAKNKTLADALGKTISDTMGHYYRGSKTRQYSSSHPDWDWYGVIRGAARNGCKAAFLIEHGFHTCTKDINFLMSDANLALLADAEAKVIANHFGIKKALYRIQVGAFSDINNANNYKKKLEADGYQAFVVKI